MLRSFYRHLFHCLAIAVAAIALGCSRDQAERPASADDATRASSAPPNVVWILLDACRADRVSWAGYERETTPNLDRLAERGAVFHDHYTQGLWTELSVPSYMTGRYFPVACVDVLRTYPMRNPPPGEILFPALLNEHGYHTAAFSAHSWILPDSPLAKAFSEFHFITPEPGKPLHAAEFATLNKHILPWLESTPRDKPFFLYIHALDTHFPHILDAPHDQWVDKSYESAVIRDGIPIQNFGLTFNDDDRALLSALYDGGIHYADAQVQRVLDALEREGLMENTIIVVSSDHGEALGEDGTSWGHWEGFDEVTRTPLLIAGPGVPAGVAVKAITENVDIVPTLVDLLGIHPQVFTPDGKSLRLLMNGKTDSLRPVALIKYFNHEYDGAPGFIVQGASFKFERDTGRDTEYLWQLPDFAASRTNAIDQRPEEAASLRAVLDDRFLPLWNAYMALPIAAIDVRIEPKLWEESASVLVAETNSANASSDGAWLFTDGALWHGGWNEDVPPLTLTMPAPTGRFIVQLEVLSTRDYEGHPASSFRFESPGMKSVEFALAPVDHTAFGYEFRDVGEVSIDGEQFTCTIDNANSAYWGALRRIRFVTPYRDANTMSEDEVAERIERLRALGYFE